MQTKKKKPVFKLHWYDRTFLDFSAHSPTMQRVIAYSGALLVLLLVIGLGVWSDRRMDAECQEQYGPDWGSISVNGIPKCVQGVRGIK